MNIFKNELARRLIQKELEAQKKRIRMEIWKNKIESGGTIEEANRIVSAFNKIFEE